MKGKVFIAWSAINEHTNKNELAIAVKEKLEQYDYLGIVGGQSRTDSGLHVGEAVLKELDQCNQAIFIMQKKENGLLSNNLMFELGYALSRFNSNKIHVFYIDIAPEDKTIPSDIKGIWANYMTSARSDDMATEIVEEFISNQKSIIPLNKMALVDSYYNIKEKIAEYPYSPSCSEYEFAQFILFFSQSGYMFRNEKEAINLLKGLMKNISNPDKELDLAITFAIYYLQFFVYIQKEDDIMYLKKEDFRALRKRLSSLKDELEGWKVDDFSQWFLMLIYDMLNYTAILYTSSPDIPENEKERYYKRSIEYANKCLEYCEMLEKNDYGKENYQCVQLYKAYMYRNLHTVYSTYPDKIDLAKNYLDLSFEARRVLLQYYDVHPINTKLYDNFEMEYYLALSERLAYIEDEDDLIDFKEDCEEYISKTESANREKNFFVDKIKRFITNIVI